MTDRSTNKSLVALRCTVAVAITLAMGAAISQIMPKEGNYDYISWSGANN